MRCVSLLALALSVLPFAAVSAQEVAGFDFVESDEGVLVTEAGQKVLFYQRHPKSFEGKFTRSHYVHPLYDLDGEILSEDFPADHRHHRGIFWAWHQVWVGDRRAGDPWVCQDFQWDVLSVETKKGDDATAELRIRVHWKSPKVVDPSGAPTPLVEETAVVRIHPAEADSRAVDFSFRLRPLVPELRIGGSEDEKGYGGFCTRIQLPDDIRFVSSRGEVHPQTTQVAAGPWMDMTGTFAADEGRSGMAILTHPTLPKHVQPWILRNHHSMQNVVWPGREAVLLPMDRPLAFNYRLLIHRGDSEAAGIGERYKGFAAEPPRLVASPD